MTTQNTDNKNFNKEYFRDGGDEMEKKKASSKFYLAVFFIFIFALSGCAIRTSHYKSSVVDYLYQDKKGVIETPSIPVLSIPLRVGVAFVPSPAYPLSSSGSPLSPIQPGAGLSASVSNEKQRIELMKKIGNEFRQYPFVKSIDIIPSPYLIPKGSFSNIDQIGTMYGIDVLVLLSYDQVQHTDENFLSLSYWTIVGAYLFKGEKNDTSTMIDAVVYDVGSRKMLFRAPGISRVRHSATLVNLSEQLRADSKEGFEMAAEDLAVNLKLQLDLFQEKLKAMPEEYEVIYKSGYTGGGSMGADSSVFLIEKYKLSGK